MSDRTPRQLLADADQARSIADGANYARLRMRLRDTPVVHRKSGLLGWVKDRSKKPDPAVFDELAPGVAFALYDALGIVERENEQRAREIEARVTAEAAR